MEHFLVKKTQELLLPEARALDNTGGLTPLGERYANDPVAFGVEVLGEHFTPDIVRVLESVRDNAVTVAKSANATGKTHGAARVAVWFYKCYRGAKVYTTAAPPFKNLKDLLWGEIGAVIDNRPALFQEDRITSLHIARSKNEFITGVAIPTSGNEKDRESKFSGKHAPALLFIVDEGDAVPDEIYRGIESCMSGGFVRLLILFNPKQKAGPVYHKIRSKAAAVVTLSALTHPNVVTGENVIPGAVDRETTVRRIQEWTRPLAPGEHVQESEKFAVPDFLTGATAKSLSGFQYPPLDAAPRVIIEPSFYYMVLGEYPPAGETQLISEADIERARERWDLYVARYGEVPPAGVKPRLGLDVAEFGVDENALCTRWGGFVGRFQTWGGVDAETSSLRVLDYHDNVLGGRDNVELVLVDATGYGSVVAPYLSRRKVRAVPVKFSERPLPHVKSDLGEFKSIRDQLWWMIREWLKTDTAMLPPDPVLIEELMVPTYSIPMDGKIHISSKDEMKQRLGGRSPDRAESLGLTLLPINRAKVRRIAAG